MKTHFDKPVRAKARTWLIERLAAVMLLVAFSGFATVAFALEVDEYTPGSDYHIDTNEAFRNQGIEHEGAEGNSSSTSYWLTCPFYLEWTSPDMTIDEGENAYIGCRAKGLDDISYEWHLSKDGGATFEQMGLVGSEHTIAGLAPNSPSNAPYLYRCLITNGDQTSTLTTDVRITVLAADEPANPDKPAGGLLPKTGDYVLNSALCLLASGVFAALALALAVCTGPRNKESEGRQEPRTSN